VKFPAIDPFATGQLPVTNGNKIYWEAAGNPRGKPALHLHGGPGSGITPGYRRLFDPERFLIVSFEQRGCGRSRPLVTDPDADLSTNTTPALLSDIEELRRYLGVEAWLVGYDTRSGLCPSTSRQGNGDRVDCRYDDHKIRSRMGH
jgi:proline iminopeptidase